MSSRVRIVTQLAGNYYNGARAVSALREYHRQFRMQMGSLPPELRNAPKWKRAIWIVQNFPEGAFGSKPAIAVLREGRGHRMRRTRYGWAVVSMGLGSKRFTHRYNELMKFKQKKRKEAPRDGRVPATPAIRWGQARNADATTAPPPNNVLRRLEQERDIPEPEPAWRFEDD